MRDNALTRFSEQYSSSTVIQTLIQLVALKFPWILVAMAPVAPSLTRMQVERMRTYYDELMMERTDVTDDVINSEDFIHCYSATTVAAFNTRQREKIRWFARLLLSGTGVNKQISYENEYEEYVKILDDVSYRELGLLAVLAELESIYPVEQEDDKDGKAVQEYRRAHRIWNPNFGIFETVACSRVGLLPSEFRSILTRRNRTGLYESIFVLVSGYDGNLGTLTPRYHRLARMIQIQGTDWVNSA